MKRITGLGLAALALVDASFAAGQTPATGGMPATGQQGSQEVPGIPGFDPDPSKWDWPGVASRPELRNRIVTGGYTNAELRNIWIVLNFLPGPRRPGMAGGAPRGAASGPAGSAPAGAAPAPGGPTIQSTGMRMPPFMVMNSVPSPISHGRGFRGLEIPYGGNGYASDGITQRTNLVDDIIASGDHVFVTWLIEGVHSNPMFGFPGSGKPVAVRESALFRFENGKVAETDFRGDDLALYVGLGGKLSFPAPTPATSGPARMGSGPMDKAGIIMAEAQRAAAMPAAQWDWPPAADEPGIRDSIIAASNTAEEKRNLFTVLAMQSGRRWPRPGTEAAKEAGRPAPVPASAAQAGAVARTGNLLGAASLFAPGSISKGRGFRGLEQFYGANGYLPDSLSDRVNRLDTIIAKGDRVWFSWIIEAKHSGTLFGFKGDGRTIKIRESAWVRFRDGQIMESDYYGDDLALYLQAGGKLSFPDGGYRPGATGGNK